MIELKKGFLAELRRIDTLSQVSSLLGWDEQVNLPSGSASSEQRAAQRSEIATLRHQRLTGPIFADQLQDLEQHPVDDDLQVILREVRRDVERATGIPAEFVARKVAHESTSYHAWKDARARNDFTSYVPALEETLKLARQEAAFIGFEDNPYDYHLDKHDPGMDLGSITQLFDELQAGLIPLSERILALAEKATVPELHGFSQVEQETFLREVVESLGFDFSRGRIDVAVHPFCSGNASDTRLTTRYDEDNPLGSLFGAIHETGHGMYEQGLPRQWLGTPLGEAA
ncbi:MAG: carboxypeptidase M32, partial [Opitutales bacterium]